MAVSSDGFAKRLRQYRIEAGYRTARAFALELAINENSYCRYERGGARPRLELINAICERLGVSQADLLTGGSRPARNVETARRPAAMRSRSS